MLGMLFGSKSRVKILKLFLLRPEEKFYIRQLARDLNLQLNSVRRELENLESFGLLLSSAADDEQKNESEKDKKIIDLILNKKSQLQKKEIDDFDDSGGRQDKKFFKVNKDFILFDEIRALIVKAQVLYEKDFIKKIEKVGSIKLLVLSGFFVGNLSSKVDLFIVGKFNKPKLVKVIKELEDELGREINYTVLDPKEFKTRRDMTDVFIFNILEGKKIVVIDNLGIS
jgi:DNA-binding transcriptional regulator YhcF (GntR family)